MPRIDDVYHVCLAGRQVASDWGLIEILRPRYLVTLAERIDCLSRRSYLDGMHLLVVDCSQNRAAALDLLPGLKREFPDLCVLLVDGGLDQKQIATAFQNGVKDYFAMPYQVNLLVERMQALLRS